MNPATRKLPSCLIYYELFFKNPTLAKQDFSTAPSEAFESQELSVQNRCQDGKA
jgi:hypothetical protein